MFYTSATPEDRHAGKHSVTWMGRIKGEGPSSAGASSGSPRAELGMLSGTDPRLTKADQGSGRELLTISSSGTQGFELVFELVLGLFSPFLEFPSGGQKETLGKLVLSCGSKRRKWFMKKSDGCQERVVIVV